MTYDSNVYDALATAIANQIPVWLTYGGTRRLVCPTGIGTSAQGRTNCHAYQTDGESSSGLGRPGCDNNWRCFHVDKISEVEPSPFTPWGTGGNHSCPNTCVVNVDVEVL